MSFMGEMFIKQGEVGESKMKSVSEMHLSTDFPGRSLIMLASEKGNTHI